MKSIVRILALITIALAFCGCSAPFAAAAPSPSQEDSLAAAALNKRVREVSWQNVPLSKAIDDLRKQTGLQIVVRWNVPQVAGIGPQTPVTLALKNVPLSVVLTNLLSQMANVSLSFDVEGNILVISTADNLARNTEVRVYDVQDILDYMAAYAQQNGASRPNNGQGLFGSGGGDAIENSGQIANDLIHAIQSTIDPNSWRDVGGTVGSIQLVASELVVCTTPSTQRQITALLSKLKNTVLPVAPVAAVHRRACTSCAKEPGRLWISRGC